MARLLLEVSDVAKHYGPRAVLESAGFTLAAGEKVGWVGANGCGKSTLMRIVAGAVEADSGTVLWHDEAVGAAARQCYAPQSTDVVVHPAGGVYPAGWFCSPGGGGLEGGGSGSQTGDEPRYEPGQAPAVRAFLGRLGFRASLFDVPWASLSGGEKAKLSLARTLANAKDIILLDEPTNHLDLPSLLWLEEWLLDFRGAAIIISHDRYFLDRLVTRIDELEDGRMRGFPGNYSAFAAQKSLEWETAWQEYRTYSAKKEQLERVARERMEWFRQAHHAAGQDDFRRAKAKKGAVRAKAARRRLEKLEEKPRPTEKPSPRLKLNAEAPIEARWAIRGEDVGKCFGEGAVERWVLRGARFFLAPGVRAVLMGPNGSGKTTLLRVIAGTDAPSEGRIAVSPQACVGYLAQELENLSRERTVLEEVLAVSTFDRARTRNYLASLLFRGEDVDKRIAVLSAGEMVRVALAKLLVGRYNLLILDEPTNHLDVRALEAVEQALTEYDGTILAASHDRYFVSRIGDEVWALAPRNRGDGAGIGRAGSGGASGKSAGRSADAASVLTVCRGGLEEYLGGAERHPGQSSTDVRGNSGERRVGDGQKLVLESRLAQLGGLLARKELTEEARAAAEADYLAIAKELASLGR